MDRELLKAKFQDDTFEAVVDYEEGEVIIKYRGNVPDFIALNIDHLQAFSDFITQIAKEELK